MTGAAPAGEARRTRLPRGEGERLRKEILDAADALLTGHGDASTMSMRDLARAVGVAPPTLYLHFADKDAILLAVCTRRFARLRDAIAAAVTDVDDPLDAIRAGAAAYVRFGLDRPAEYRYLFMSPEVFPVPDDATLDDLPGVQAFGLLVELVRRAIAEGALAATDAVMAATALWTSLHGVVAMLLNEGGPHVARLPGLERLRHADGSPVDLPLADPDALTAFVVDTVLRGLRSSG